MAELPEAAGMVRIEYTVAASHTTMSIEDHSALKIASQRRRRIEKFCKVLGVIGKQSFGSPCATTQGKSSPNDSMGSMWAKVRFLDPKLGIMPLAWEVQNLDWFGLGFTKIDGA